MCKDVFGVFMSVPSPQDREGDFLELLAGCDVDGGLPMPSVKGEYGAAIECGGALIPDCSFGGSAAPGHFLCSWCILSSGSPTTWYFAQFTGGQRTMFWGCGMGGNLGGTGGASMLAESLRASSLWRAGCGGWS